MAIKLISEKDKSKTYKVDGFKISYRKKGSIAGDNAINKKEIIYFITGKAEITLKDKVWRLKSPAKIDIPEKTYHKIKALTNISFIIFNK